MSRAFAAAALTLVLLVPPAACAADLSGPLSGSMPAGVYTISDDISVASGQTLSLAPGVVFEFEDSLLEEYEFNVEGTLLAEGTAGSPIVFRTASGVSEFNYMRIASSSTVMRHCIVEDAGKVSLVDEGGLWIDGASPLIEDCEVRSGAWHGIYVTGGGAAPTIRRTVVHGNANDGIDADSGAGLTLENCSVYGNGGDGICMANGTNTLVGCLVWGNGEDGIDCHGLVSYDVAIVNCTVGPHPAEGLSDDSEFRLYNTLVVDANDGVALAEHSLVIDDVTFFGFVNAGAGDFRLTASSPAANYGTKYGTAGALLPATDLDGGARIHGIVDAGAYESSHPVSPGTGGDRFSANLLQPRLGQPVLREDGESFEILIGLMGTYSTGDVSVELVSPEGDVVALTVTSVTAHTLTPGADLTVMLYEPGLDEVQEITVGVPAGTPADFYDIAVDVDVHHYESEGAVRIYDDYPTSWGVLHITDTHVGYDADVYSAAERLGFLVEEANWLDPELVVLTGDVCENMNDGHDWPQQFLDVVAGLRVPIYVIPGNHDYYNDGESYDPAGWMRYFHEINRFENSVLEFGNARFYGMDTRWDHGLLQLWRCHGPEDDALAWAEADIATLGSGDKPRFWLMHGPTFDTYSWIVNNATDVRDILNANDFALGLAGHTHRMETFLNSGTNSFGRNDFQHEDDWVRDVAFPGYPLHSQTSSLGKDEGLVARAERELAESGDPDSKRLLAELRAAHAAASAGGQPSAGAGTQRGPFGDSMSWRWIQVDGTDVTFFTADTDNDGYRNTEDAWFLGLIEFTLDNQPDGTIVSSVENQHYESWTDVRHYVPADPGTDYLVDGGTLVRRLPDGTAVVAVAAVAAEDTTVVTLTPDETDVPAVGEVFAFRLHPASPNPFNPETRIAFELPHSGRATLAIYSVGGRRVATLVDAELPAGPHAATWRGLDDAGHAVASGVYLAKLRAAGETAAQKLVLMK